MADGLNSVQLLGNLCADPELRFTQAGQAVLNLRIATNDSYLDKDKVRRERTDFHSCVIWGKRAEGLAKVLNKGSSLFVQGSLRTSSYDDREGNKRYKTEVVVQNVILTGGRRGGDGDRGAPEDGAPGEGEYAREARHAEGGRGGGYQQRAQSGRGGGGQSNGQRQAPARSAAGAAPEAAPPQDDYAGDYGGGGAGGDDDIPFSSCAIEHDLMFTPRDPLRRVFG